MHFHFHFLALVHDLAESIVGDITPYCGVSKEDKKQREMNAMREIAELIAPRGQRLMELFEVCPQDHHMLRSNSFVIGSWLLIVSFV